jgi:RimJ/RimL family protein N-acetyltransferase
MKRFTIRRYQLEDVAGLYAAADESREHVGRWMDWMTPDYSLKDAQTWVEFAVAAWERGEEYPQLIVDTDDQSIVGSCGLNCLNRKDLVCNLGYWVRASRLGEGAAGQAALLLGDFGIRVMGFNRLEIVVAVGNDYSRQVAEKSGARYEGVQQMRLSIGKVAHDAHVYALLNPGAPRANAVNT